MSHPGDSPVSRRGQHLNATPIISVCGVSKAFGATIALRDVSVTLRTHAIHGLVGPNGAGKTTLLSILIGMADSDTGAVRVERVGPAGPETVSIGYQPEEPALYDHLTVKEFLDLAVLIGGQPASHGTGVATMMDVFELTQAQHTQTRLLSAGTRRKVAIAAALIQAPECLVLDEPTNGLDTTAVLRLKEHLRELRERGTAVLLSTHILDFAESLCDDVTVLVQGRVRYSGSAFELIRTAGGGSLEQAVALLLRAEGSTPHSQDAWVKR